MPAKGCTAVPESMFLTLPLALVLSLSLSLYLSLSLSPSSSTLPAVPSVCVFCAPSPPFQVLCLLLEFLAQVAALSNVNEMTSEVLSQVGQLIT